MSTDEASEASPHAVALPRKRALSSAGAAAGGGPQVCTWSLGAMNSSPCMNTPCMGVIVLMPSRGLMLMHAVVDLHTQKRRARVAAPPRRPLLVRLDPSGKMRVLLAPPQPPALLPLGDDEEDHHEGEGFGGLSGAAVARALEGCAVRQWRGRRVGCYKLVLMPTWSCPFLFIPTPFCAQALNHTPGWLS